MPRAKRLGIRNKELRTKRIKKEDKRRSYKKKQSAKIKQFRSFKGLLLTLVLIFILGSSFLFLILRARVDNSSQDLPSPIIHLVASLSAQTQPIKIDPEFSYQEEQLKQEVPIKVVIPSVKIDVPIVEAQIVDGYWETATNSASFGLGSAYPGQSGNTVIFAHAQEGLFTTLRFIQKEASVYLFTNSSWFSYKVDEIKTVAPSQIEVVSPTKEKTLTLFTCSGYQDAERLIIIARP